MFGGFDSSIVQGPALGDTWVWRTGAWEEQTPTRHPPARMWAAMTFDSERREVVLFGGVEQHSPRTTGTPWIIVRKYPPNPPQKGTEVEFRDTWVWDGKDWMERNLPQAPSQRCMHAMAYDANRKQVVLFGGFDNEAATALNDTWVWNGNDWGKMHPLNVPPARYWHSMAYDPIHHQIVMFGGRDAGANALNDTWLWDGNDWSNATSSENLPEPRSEAGMAYDPGLERILLISGFVEDVKRVGSPANDTWTWDGSQWAKLPQKEFQLLDRKDLKPQDVNRALVVSESAMASIWIPKRGIPPGLSK
jgi:hypothetical protein